MDRDKTLSNVAIKKYLLFIIINKSHYFDVAVVLFCTYSLPYSFGSSIIKTRFPYAIRRHLQKAPSSGPYFINKNETPVEYVIQRMNNQQSLKGLN